MGIDMDALPWHGGRGNQSQVQTAQREAPENGNTGNQQRRREQNLLRKEEAPLDGSHNILKFILIRNKHTHIHSSEREFKQETLFRWEKRRTVRGEGEPENCASSECAS